MYLNGTLLEQKHIINIASKSNKVFFVIENIMVYP
jgi:hypothetical protein